MTLFDKEEFALIGFKRCLLQNILAKAPINPTHRRLGDKLGIPAAIAGRLKRGEVEGFTLDYLIKLNIRLGYQLALSWQEP